MSHGGHTVGSVAAESESETIYRNPFTAEMERRKAHLHALAGYRLKVDLEALNRCSYTFGRNAEELSNHVGRFLGSHTASAHELSDEYVNELVRLLHNYLTSVTSLIDAQRVVMRHRWPSAKKGEYSEFETTDYARQLKETFETGEAEFMQKLRNYCTHYSIPVPGLGTRMSWEAGGPVLRVNTLQLDREELLRWDEWRAAATAYLRAQPERFDFAPIIERYMAGVRLFYQWFWEQVNARSAHLVSELNAKGMEVKLWYDEHDLRPDWLFKGDGLPPPDWNGRLERARRRRARYQHGAQGFRVSVIDGEGTIEVGSTNWDPLPN
jgi:hypothetical protein